jgi:predicted ATPase
LVISHQYVSRVTLLWEKVDTFDRYPFCLPAVHSRDVVESHPMVTFFIGENGSGKSTLLEAIAVSLGFNAEGGSKNFRFATCTSHSELHSNLRVAIKSKPTSAACIRRGRISRHPSRREVRALYTLRAFPKFTG